MRIIVSIISITTVGLWMTTPIHGIHVAAISLIPIVGLTMTQVLGAADVRGLPWDTLMLVAGGLSLGAAVVDTGLAARLGLPAEMLERELAAVPDNGPDRFGRVFGNHRLRQFLPP